MPVLPTVASFRVLLACSEAVESKHRWVHLTPSEVPGLAGLTPGEIQEAVSELTQRGYCAPAAYGDLMYITREGAKLARAARDLLGEGRDVAELTLESLAPALVRFPFFRIPEELRTRSQAEPLAV
jgi:hypothetical protein